MPASVTRRKDRFAWMTAPTMLAATVLVVAAGCQKSPFVSDAPRTPFELHDRLNNRYVPLEEPDEFGTPQPALRARLGRPY